MRTRNFTPGLILIAVGAMLLLGNLNIIEFDFGYIWPLFMLIPGIVQEITYLVRRKHPGNLVSAAIMTTYGALFLYLNHFGWDQMSLLWPLFITGVGLGLMQLYFAQPKHQSLYPGLILTVFSLGYIALMYYNLDFSLMYPVIIILIGLSLIFRPKKFKDGIHVNIDYDFGEKTKDNVEDNEHIHVHTSESKTDEDDK